MKKITLVAVCLGTIVAATPAVAQRNWDWSGGRPGTRDYRLIGAGVPALFPELRGTNRGRAFVLRNFDFNRDGRVAPREANAANRAFAQIAGARRDRFDWNQRDRGLCRRGGGRSWPRSLRPPPMRDYGFRQTERGATMTLEEQVLFATDSAVLRPGAVDKTAAARRLSARQRQCPRRDRRPHRFAWHRQPQPGPVAAPRRCGTRRVRPDGRHPRTLAVEGFGESRPVATNATPQGMRQNRRVEVTLLGQRAETFARYQ